MPGIALSVLRLAGLFVLATCYLVVQPQFLRREIPVGKRKPPIPSLETSMEMVGWTSPPVLPSNFCHARSSQCWSRQLLVANCLFRLPPGAIRRIG